MRTLLLLLPTLMLSGQTAPTPAPAAKTRATVKTASVTKAAAPLTNYKESGSPTAPVTFEIYADYECPSCGVFFRNIVPDLIALYVRTGKVKFYHRDFPLVTIHQHAQLAARYADAAGELGFYELAVAQIYKTQDEWSQYGKNTGDIDAELVKVLPPGAMQKVRDLVKNDSRLDDGVKKDVDMAMNLDHVNGTPTVVIVSKGKREVIASAASLPLSVWKSYLDKKLAEQ
jgi:protein-disulfide isomerase